MVFDQGASAYNDYRVNGVPNLFFVGSDGLMVATYPGAMPADQLETQIKQLLEEG